MHPLLQSVLPTSDFSVSLPSLGILQIKGADAAKFLQGQITQDVLTMQDYEQRLSACCNAQGRIRAVFRLTKLPDGFFLVMPRAVTPSLHDALKKYAVFFKVQIEDVSAQWQIEGHYRLEATSMTPSTAAAIWLPLDQHRHLLLKSSASSLESADEARWFALDILHHLAWIWPETVETLLPHDIGLKDVNGIHFEKGCYTGQEIVARMEYRGKLKNTVAIGFSALTDRIDAGTEVNAGEARVGAVLGAARHPIAGQLLLLGLKESALVDALTLNLPSRPILQLLT